MARKNKSAPGTPKFYVENPNWKKTGGDNRNSLHVWRVQIDLKAMCLSKRPLGDYKFTQNTLSKLRKNIE